MKRLMLFTVASLLCASFSVASAQGQKSRGEFGKNSELYNLLTDEQKNMLEKSEQEIKALHKAFRASLNDSQRAIMDDKSITWKERKEKLNPTLTEEQRTMLKLISDTKEKQKKQFLATLTAEQKEALEKLKEKGSGHGNIHDKKRP